MHEITMRLKKFPAAHDARGVRQFVMRKFEQAELCKDTDGQMAAEHMADGLYMLSCKEANRLLAHLRCTMSTKMYKSVDAKYEELLITKSNARSVAGGPACTF